MSKYLYYAVFEQEEDGYNVSFPDLPGCLTCGDDMSDALHMAQDVLEGWMIGVENDKETIVTPSEPKQIDIPKDALLIPVEADTKLARIKFANKAVKKTLTLPFWLNQEAEQAGVNFSKILQDGLVNYLKGFKQQPLYVNEKTTEYLDKKSDA